MRIDKSKSPTRIIHDSAEHARKKTMAGRLKISRSRSIADQGTTKAVDQSSDSLKTLSPINDSAAPAPEEGKVPTRPLLTDLPPGVSKDLENPIKSDKSITMHEINGTFCQRMSLNNNTFLGEGCASFLSQTSLLSKLTQHPKAAQTKLVTSNP